MIWAILGVHTCLVRPWADLENKIAHKDVQKKVECDPCAVSSCEPDLLYESAFGHESRRRYSHFADLSIFLVYESAFGCSRESGGTLVRAEGGTLVRAEGGTLVRAGGNFDL